MARLMSSPPVDADHPWMHSQRWNEAEEAAELLRPLKQTGVGQSMGFEGYLRRVDEVEDGLDEFNGPRTN
jgi:hypothetical protein